MSLELGTHIADLVATNPPGSDKRHQGDDHLRLIKSVLQATFPAAASPRYFWSPEATVPSAATCDILGAAAEKVRVTGTTAITSFGTGAQKVRYVRFTGAMLLTHNATSLILPGGEDITTATDDTCIVVSDGSSNARVYAYQRGAQAPLPTTTLGFLVQTAPGVIVGRSLVEGTGIRILDGAGAVGDPVISFDQTVDLTLTGQYTFVRADTVPSIRIMTLESGGSASPRMSFVRLSATPFAGDNLGQLIFSGNNASATQRDYATILVQALVVETGPTGEKGRLIFSTLHDGVPDTRLVIGGGLHTKNLTDMGPGTINAGTLYQSNIPIPASIQAADPTLDALALFNTNGLLAQTAPDTFVGRSIAAGANVAVTNGNGVAGNPTVALDPTTTLNWSGAINASGAVTISSTAAGTLLTLLSTDGGSGVGPRLVLRRASDSPAANDNLGQLLFTGEDAALATKDYGAVLMNILTTGAGTHTGRLLFSTAQGNGSTATAMIVAAGVHSSGVPGGDKGVGTINFGTIYQSNVPVAVLAAQTFPPIQTISGSVAGNYLVLTSTDAGAASGPNIEFYRNSATAADLDLLGALTWNGNGEFGGGARTYATIQIQITDNLNLGERGAIYFQVAGGPAVSGALTNAMVIGEGIVVGSPVGGHKGLGTLNAQALYDDNLLLTDYVFDIFLDGHAAPGERDPRAERMWKSQELFSPASYERHWRENRSLPHMPAWDAAKPSLGELTNAVWENMELQAIHTAELNTRLTALEAKARVLP